MHRKYRLWILFLLLLLITPTPPPITAQGIAPPICATSGPPRPPDHISPPLSTAIVPSTALNLAPLKAVLLVGPIDGNDGDWTQAEIANMELAATELEAHSVTVYRFYPGDSDWAQIEAAAEGAHFLLYRGHGVYDGNLPHPNVGGFSLSSGYYSPDRIRQNLHLAPDAIVMLYGCFTTGSSSAEGDRHDIGITEAGRRVAQYSDPFFDIGAAGYYANWFGNAFQQFLAPATPSSSFWPISLPARPWAIPTRTILILTLIPSTAPLILTIPAWRCGWTKITGVTGSTTMPSSGSPTRR
jgi:hypothetical protein